MPRWLGYGIKKNDHFIRGERGMYKNGIKRILDILVSLAVLTVGAIPMLLEASTASRAIRWAC